MSFSTFLIGTLLASVAMMVGLLALPSRGLGQPLQPLEGLRLHFGPDDLLD